MKLLAPIAAIIAAAAAGQIYNTAPHQDSYANSAEAYQSQLEYQQNGLYNDQSQAYTGHASAYQGRPAGEKTAKILAYVSENNGHSYQYAYETENEILRKFFDACPEEAKNVSMNFLLRIKAQEAGQTVKGTEAHGTYSYTGDDGHTYTVNYVADEHGFRAEGAHLPTPPPIPEAIAKAIEQNAKDEAEGIFDDGKYKEVQHHEGQGQEYEAQIHQAQAEQPQHHQAHAHQAQTQQIQGHHAQIHQAQSHQTQIQHPQIHYPKIYKAKAVHHKIQYNQQPRGFQKSSEMYQQASHMPQHYETSFQHDTGYSGSLASAGETLYHKY